MDFVIWLNNQKPCIYNSLLSRVFLPSPKVKMEIGFIACLLIILCAQVLVPSNAIENKLPSYGSSIDQLKSLVLDHEVHATRSTINSNAREYLVRRELVNSKNSHGLRGPGGGANIVRQPRTVKSNAMSLIKVLS